jgi:hypothetical protein
MGKGRVHTNERRVSDYSGRETTERSGRNQGLGDALKLERDHVGTGAAGVATNLVEGGGKKALGERTARLAPPGGSGSRAKQLADMLVETGLPRQVLQPFPGKLMDAFARDIGRLDSQRPFAERFANPARVRELFDLWIGGNVSWGLLTPNAALGSSRAPITVGKQYPPITIAARAAYTLSLIRGEPVHIAIADKLYLLDATKRSVEGPSGDWLIDIAAWRSPALEVIPRR